MNPSDMNNQMNGNFVPRSYHSDQPLLLQDLGVRRWRHQWRNRPAHATTTTTTFSGRRGPGEVFSSARGS